MGVQEGERGKEGTFMQGTRRKIPQFCEMSLTDRFAAVFALQNLAAKVNTFAETYAIRLGM